MSPRADRSSAERATFPPPAPLGIPGGDGPWGMKPGRGPRRQRHCWGLLSARSRRGCGRPTARPLRCRASRRSRPKISRPESKRPTLKFMPMMPPSTVAGRRITVTSVSTFMMSFVRCPIRVTRRSNEPKVDSFASRAVSSAWVTRRSRSANRCADFSLESASSSGCERETTTSRCGESALRSVPIVRRSSTSRVRSSAAALGVLVMTLASSSSSSLSTASKARR